MNVDVQLEISVQPSGLFCLTDSSILSRISPHSLIAFRGISSSLLKMSSPMKTGTTVVSPSKRKVSSPTKSPVKKVKVDADNENKAVEEINVLRERTDPSNVEKEKTGDKASQMESEKLFFVKVTEHAFAPTKGSKLAAGFDLKR